MLLLNSMYSGFESITMNTVVLKSDFKTLSEAPKLTVVFIEACVP